MVNRYVFRVLNRLQKTDMMPIAARRAILRVMGIRIDGRPVVMSGVDFLQGDIALGDGAFSNYRCLIEGCRGIVIGARASLAQGVMLITESHALGPSECRAGPMEGAAISVAAGCWIGANSTLLPGTVMEPGAVLGAHSLGRGRLAANVLHAGNPAIPRRDLSSAIDR